MKESQRIEWRGDLRRRLRCVAAAAIALAVVSSGFACGSGSPPLQTTNAAPAKGFGASPTELQSELTSLQTRISTVDDPKSARSLGDHLVEFSRYVYDSYVAQLTQLKEKLDRAREAINTLVQKDPRTAADDAEIKRLQTESERLSDEMKAKTLYFQSMFDVLSQVTRTLDRIIMRLAEQVRR
jgi:hypothetical protein